jgi:hypothetical protein
MEFAAGKYWEASHRLLLKVARPSGAQTLANLRPLVGNASFLGAAGHASPMTIDVCEGKVAGEAFSIVLALAATGLWS